MMIPAQGKALKALSDALGAVLTGTLVPGVYSLILYKRLEGRGEL